MVSLSAPSDIAQLPLPRGAATVRIEPPRGWIDLRLNKVWQYRELLFFWDAHLRVRETHKTFLMIGRRWDLDLGEPLDFQEPGLRE